MSAPYTLLDAATGDGASGSIRSQENLARVKAYQVIGTFSATVAIQGSMDGVNWQNLATVTAPGLANIPWCPFLRANVSGYVSGSITVKVV